MYSIKSAWNYGFIFSISTEPKSERVETNAGLQDCSTLLLLDPPSSGAGRTSQSEPHAESHSNIHKAGIKA